MQSGRPRPTSLWSIALILLFPFWAAAQPGIFHTKEPPLAGSDPDVIQAGGQYPAYGPNAAGISHPFVTVTIIAPPQVPHGKDLDYKLRIENPSSYSVQEVQVIHPLPKGSRIVKADPKPTATNDDAIWNIGTVAAGGRQEIFLTVTPPSDLTEWTHTAKVRFEHTRQVKTKVARPELGLRLIAQKEYQQFDIVTLRLEVANPGLMEVKDIAVNMQVPDGTPIDVDPPIPGRPPTANDPKTRQWTIPRLGPSETRFFDVRVVAKGLGTHSIVSQAVAAAGAKSDNKTEVTILAPKLEVTAIAPARRQSNQTASCRINVRNAGPHLMRNVTVNDKFIGGAELVAASDGGQSFDREVQWIIPFLQPGETRTFDLTTRNPAGGKATHSVSATYRGFKQSTEATTEFFAMPDLRVELRGQPDAVAVGDTIRFQVTVENHGSAPATNVKPTIILADSFTFVSSEQSTQTEGSRVVFDTVTIPSGGKQVFLVSARSTRANTSALTTLELRADVLESGPLRRQETTVITNGR